MCGDGAWERTVNRRTWQNRSPVRLLLASTVCVERGGIVRARDLGRGVEKSAAATANTATGSSQLSSADEAIYGIGFFFAGAKKYESNLSSAAFSWQEVQHQGVQYSILVANCGGPCMSWQRGPRANQLPGLALWPSFGAARGCGRFDFSLGSGGALNFFEMSEWLVGWLE